MNAFYPSFNDRRTWGRPHVSVRQILDRNPRRIFRAEERANISYQRTGRKREKAYRNKLESPTRKFAQETYNLSDPPFDNCMTDCIYMGEHHYIWNEEGRKNLRLWTYSSVRGWVFFMIRCHHQNQSKDHKGKRKDWVWPMFMDQQL